MSKLTPPTNIDAEMQILGSMLLDRKNIPKVIERLGGQDGAKFFHAPQHAALYSAIAELHSQGRHPAFPQFVNLVGEKRLERMGGEPYLTELTGLAYGDIDPELLTILIDVAHERMLYRAARKSLTLLEEMNDKGREEVNFKEGTMKAFREAMLFQSPEARTLKLIAKETIDEWQDRMKSGGILGQPSVLNRVNRMTGGYVKGRLTIIGARPGMGKTSLALQDTYNTVKKGGRACIVTLEMSDTELLGRIVCQEARVNYSQLQTDPQTFFAETEPKWAKDGDIIKAFEAIRNAGLVIIDKPGADINQICAAIENAHYDAPLDMAIIDYLQLISGMSEEHRVQAISDVCMNLKQLAKRLNIAIVLLSQLSREVEKRKDKRPMASDLRDSGGIEQAADLLMFIYRESEYDPKLKDAAKKVAEIIVAKNRFGGRGTLYVFFHGPTTRFYEDDYVIGTLAIDDKYPSLNKEHLANIGILQKIGKDEYRVVASQNTEETTEVADDLSGITKPEDAKAEKPKNGQKAASGEKAEIDELDDEDPLGSDWNTD